MKTHGAPAVAPYLFGVGKTNELASIQGTASALMKTTGFAASGPVRMSASGPSTLQTNVEPLISLAVLELGTPQHAAFPGTIIAPDILKSSWLMQFWSWTGTPQLEIGEEGLERAFSVPRRQVRFTGETTSTQMTRRGVEVPLDVDEIRISENQLQLAAHASALSRDMVKLAVEREKQQLLGVAASYPGGHSLDAATAEWDAAGGDSKTDINLAVDQLVSANQPYQRESIHVVITYAARDAAFNDPTWEALPNSVLSRGNYPSMEDLATYWGVGRVSLADAVFDDGTGVVASMWGAVAVAFVDPRLQGGLITEWGRAQFAVNFTFQGAVISAPYLDPHLTSIFHPFDGWDHPTQIKGTAGFLIFNVKA